MYWLYIPLISYMLHYFFSRDALAFNFVFGAFRASELFSYCGQTWLIDRSCLWKPSLFQDYKTTCYFLLLVLPFSWNLEEREKSLWTGCQENFYLESGIQIDLKIWVEFRVSKMVRTFKIGEVKWEKEYIFHTIGTVIDHWLRWRVW